MNDQFYANVATWSQVAASLLFIALLVYGWQRFLAPMVLASQARKNAELADAVARRDAARDEIDAAQREVGIAAEQARSIGERAAADAKRIAERIATDAGAEGERLIKNANGELERSRAAARDALRVELLDRALTIARGNAANLSSATDLALIEDAVATADRGGGAA